MSEVLLIILYYLVYYYIVLSIEFITKIVFDRIQKSLKKNVLSMTILYWVED